MKSGTNGPSLGAVTIQRVFVNTNKNRQTIKLHEMVLNDVKNDQGMNILKLRVPTQRLTLSILSLWLK